MELPLSYAGVKHGERRRRAEAALRLVGLTDRMHAQPNQLSGGQQQRVAVARALVTAPSLILADEPTGNLDTKASRDLMEVFDRLNAAGRTIVLITHEADVAAHAKRVIQVQDGRIVADRRVTGPAPSRRSCTAGRRSRVVSPAQIFRFALAGLSANKLRSALTTLGILIGVGSVILLVAVGNGSSQSVQNAISSLGTSSITVLHTEGRPAGGGADVGHHGVRGAAGPHRAGRAGPRLGPGGSKRFAGGVHLARR